MAYLRKTPSKPLQTANISSPGEKLMVFAGLALVAIIFTLSTFLAKQIIPSLGEAINPDSFAQKNFVMKSIMLSLTLIAMFVLYKTKGLTYGFNRGRDLNYGKYTKHAILLALAGLITLIIFNIIGFIVTKQPPKGFPDEHILHRILFIWIWSSVVEEILFRGLFQSLIGSLSYPLFKFRKATISMAMFLSGLAFASLHLFLLYEGMSFMLVMGLFIFTLLCGLLAAYLREKTGSIYPSIYVHIIFNIVGSLPIIIKLISGG
jgi:membrane protease YdiL (CAAX protease family)